MHNAFSLLRWMNQASANAACTVCSIPSRPTIPEPLSSPKCTGLYISARLCEVACHFRNSGNHTAVTATRPYVQSCRRFGHLQSGTRRPKKIQKGESMTQKKTIRAWKDPEYRMTLSIAERAALPANPAGAIELTDADLERASGGATSEPIFTITI